MKRLGLGLLLLVLGLPVTASAQQPAPGNGNLDNQLGEVTPVPTAEMWFYLQEMRRYDDPKNVVRRNAEMRAAQRRERIAAMNWYGLSNSRPRASATPYMGVYSPQWGGQRYYAPRWGYFRMSNAETSSQIYVLSPPRRQASLSQTAQTAAAPAETKVASAEAAPSELK